ncbi:toxin-activating lysine-acyltransferase [Raoultella sp. RIT712]|uniref:toxin-activating lysine-acyltransferase n=1 Tax=Raoultella sp. RIT712 TaxID=2666191 RepID=UPI0012AD9984|nr:toxin-activating lysine-acyltransferase [Raoultella sp. RIT712]MRT47643.1 toxin-activating lysine-acyltransferase [Raoultella sp. RIT712]
MNNDIYRIIGNAFELLAHSTLHSEYNVYYIFNYVFVPAKQQNIHVYYNENQHPVAYFSWALITSGVQANLTDDSFIMTSDDWNGGQRLYIHDLVAPWGGSAYIVRDIKYRFFPFVFYGFGVRRKNNARPRIGVFFTNRTNVKLHSDLNQSIDKMCECFDNIEYVLKHLNIMLGEYELKYSLDINDELNITALRQVRRKYDSIIKHVEVSAKLKMYTEDQNLSLVNYLNNINKPNITTSIRCAELATVPKEHDEQVFY